MASSSVKLTPDALADYFARIYRAQKKISSWVTLYVNIVDNVAGLEESNMFAYNSTAVMCNDETRKFIRLIFDNMAQFMTGSPGTVVHTDSDIFTGERTQIIQVGTKTIWLYFDSVSTAKAYARCMRVKILKRMEELDVDMLTSVYPVVLPTLPTTTPVPASPRSPRIAVSPRITGRVVSPRRTGRAVSPRRTGRVVSPRRTGGAVSPRRTGRVVSPRITGGAVSVLAPIPSEIAEFDQQLSDFSNQRFKLNGELDEQLSILHQYDNWDILDEIHVLKRRYDLKVKQVRDHPGNKVLIKQLKDLENKLMIHGIVGEELNIPYTAWDSEEAQDIWFKTAKKVKSIRKHIATITEKFMHLETNRNLLLVLRQ